MHVCVVQPGSMRFDLNPRVLCIQHVVCVASLYVTVSLRNYGASAMRVSRSKYVFRWIG